MVRAALTGMKKEFQLRTRYYWTLLVRTFCAWDSDNGLRMGAALAYYALFSLVPILFVAVTVAGAVFGDASAQAEMLRQVRYYVGPHGAEAVRGLMAPMAAAPAGPWGAIVSVAVLFFSASGLVSELQSALNDIWRVEPPPRLWLALLRRRILAIGFVLGSGFLLLLTLVLSAVISAVSNYMGAMLPFSELSLRGAEFLLSFGVATFLVAMVYKYLPDVRIAWRDVWTGAGVTSVLLTLGNQVIGLFLVKSGIATGFGAAGSLILVVVWIYYASQLLYFGAEFTRVHAQERGLAAGRRS
jgi:membrane protein